MLMEVDIYLNSILNTTKLYFTGNILVCLGPVRTSVIKERLRISLGTVSASGDGWDEPIHNMPFLIEPEDGETSS